MLPKAAARPLIVTGDISIDWLTWPVPAEREANSAAANWRLLEGTRMVARRGGALLLADLLRFCRVKRRPSESRRYSLACGERSGRCYSASR
jgi:hypothetical protein